MLDQWKHKWMALIQKLDHMSLNYQNTWQRLGYMVGLKGAVGAGAAAGEGSDGGLMV